MEEGHKFRTLLLGAGMDFRNKVKKLAAGRSPEGSHFMSNPAEVSELV